MFQPIPGLIHQLRWGDREMGTAISCTKYRQVAWVLSKRSAGGLWRLLLFVQLYTSLPHPFPHTHNTHTHKVYDTEVYANYRNRKVGQQIDHRFSMNLNRTTVSWCEKIRIRHCVPWSSVRNTSRVLAPCSPSNGRREKSPEAWLVSWHYTLLTQIKLDIQTMCLYHKNIRF